MHTERSVLAVICVCVCVIKFYCVFINFCSSLSHSRTQTSTHTPNGFYLPRASLAPLDCQHACRTLPVQWVPPTTTHSPFTHHQPQQHLQVCCLAFLANCFHFIYVARQTSFCLFTINQQQICGSAWSGKNIFHVHL